MTFYYRFLPFRVVSPIKGPSFFAIVDSVLEVNERNRTDITSTKGDTGKHFEYTGLLIHLWA